jgi:FKBP-type peptidyl-prolyl cis-trans isomerase
MGYNMCRNFKSQNPDADYSQILEGIKAASGGEDRSSYVFGYQMMTRLKEQNIGIGAEQLEVGIKKVIAGEELGVSDQEIQMMMMAFGQMVEQKRIADMKKTVADNKAAGEAYIEQQTAANPNLKELKDGIYYEVLKAGTGPVAGPNARVKFDYTGSFTDGEVFDSSEKPIDGSPGEPAEESVSGVIPGFSKALQAMNTGARWRVIIPGEQGYGVRGSGGKIGPMQTLVFELSLLEIKEEVAKPGNPAIPVVPGQPPIVTPPQNGDNPGGGAQPPEQSDQKGPEAGAGGN